jgi:hypothetical protein
MEVLKYRKYLPTSACETEIRVTHAGITKVLRVAKNRDFKIYIIKKNPLLARNWI